MECHFAQPVAFNLVVRVHPKQNEERKKQKMKANQLFNVTTLVVVLTVAANSFAGERGSGAKASSTGPSSAAQAAKPGSSTIVEIVLQPDGEFDMLQAAVVRAGLAGVLNGQTQYTVFAPTDAAFVATLGVTDEAEALEVINALPLDALTNILLYHITPGRRTSTSVLAAPQYNTLNGKHLTRAELLAAGIAAVDISASNGVIHVINHVLIP